MNIEETISVPGPSQNPASQVPEATIAAIAELVAEKLEHTNPMQQLPRDSGTGKQIGTLCIWSL